jgi:hypothetical protein
MTFYTFNRLLSPAMQLYWAIHDGTYLAQRRDNGTRVKLYHCADESLGFFVEVGITGGQGQATVNMG